MDEGVVEHDHQRFAHLAAQIFHKAQKALGGTGLPVVGMHDRATAEQRGDGIEALAARGINPVLLAAWRPSASVGVNLREACLVEVGQFDLARQRLGPQLVERLVRLGEGGGISFFSSCGAFVSTPYRWP